MPRKAASKVPPEPINIEESLDRLEAVVKEIEGGVDSLDKALELFEEGMMLAGRCRKRLAEAEARVERLITEASSERFEAYDQAQPAAEEDGDDEDADVTGLFEVEDEE